MSRKIQRLDEENNRLFFGVVKAIEYFRGSTRSELSDTVKYLESVLDDYGIRDPEKNAYRRFESEDKELAEERVISLGFLPEDVKKNPKKKNTVLVFEYLKEHGERTSKQIGDDLGMIQSTLRNLLRKNPKIFVRVGHEVYGGKKYAKWGLKK